MPKHSSHRLFVDSGAGFFEGGNKQWEASSAPSGRQRRSREKEGFRLVRAQRTSLLLTSLLAFSVVGCGDAGSGLSEVEETLDVSGEPGASSELDVVSEPGSGREPGTANEAPVESGAFASEPREIVAGLTGGQSSSAAHVPSELIVKFKSETSAAVTADFARALRDRRSLADITADGSNSLDAWLGRHAVRDAARLLASHAGLSTEDAKTRLRARAALPTRLRNTPSNSAATAPAQGTLSPFEGLVNVYRLRLGEGVDLDAAMAELSKDPHVEYVHKNYVARLNYTPNDTYFSKSGSYGQPRADMWNVKNVRAPLAWDSARGAGVVVAVLDTGVDISHPDLTGNVWSNSDEIAGNGVDDDHNGYVDDVNGWSVDQKSASLVDNAGHGTHVAGIIAAQDNNGKGIVGMAPDARIMPVQVFGGSGGLHQSSDVFTLSQGLAYAAQNGADVINNSWSVCQDGSCPSVPVIEDAVRAAHTSGSVVVFAAGNSTLDVRQFSPQNMPEVIVVSATTPTDTRADFSNFGLLDIGAPGAGDINDPGVVLPKSGILSLRSTTCTAGEACNEDYRVGDNYSRLAGTSFAAPMVSGAAALVLSLHPEYTPEQVRQVLRRTSKDVGATGYDSNAGYGRLDVGAISAEQTPLEALIQMPAVFDTNSVSIGGKAFGSQFARYTLEYGAGASPTTWTQLYTSTTPQQNGLYFWKPQTLPDGDYTMRLRVYKTNGAVYEDRHLFTLDRIALSSPSALAALPGGDVAILGSASPGDFQSYSLRVQKLETGASVNANIVLSNSGLSPVLKSTLAVWKTQGLAAGHYKLTLTVNKASGVATESVAVVVDPLLHAGAPFDLGSHEARSYAQGSRALSVVDLQNDGKAEIVTGVTDSVYVFGGDGQTLPGWPRSVKNAENLYESLAGAPLVGDIDGDGSKDIVASTYNGLVFAWSATGVLKPGWPRVVQGSGISLADVDRNGALDVVITDTQTGVHVLSGSGNELPGWPVYLPEAYGPATVADLNVDGRNEVIVSAGNTPNKLYVFNSSGVVQSGWPRSLQNTGYELLGSQPVVGDMDDDGDLEIVAVTSDDGNAAASRVFIYHHNGALLSSWSPNAPRVGPPVLGDVDGDGSLEVLASVVKSDGAGALHVWSRTGAALPGWPKNAPVTQGAGPLQFVAPIVADIDGDARSEVIVARGGEFTSSDLEMNYGFPIQVYRHDGVLLTSLARPTFGSWSRSTWSPTLADIDGDAKLELLWMDVRESVSKEGEWTRSPRVYSWDLVTPTTRAQSWTAERADARSSGVAQSVVPVVRLSQRNTTRRVTGMARFVVRAGGGGVLQIKHPQGAVVQYAVGNNLLQYTTLGWGQQLNVPPNQDVKFRVVTTSATDVTVDWW